MLDAEDKDIYEMLHGEEKPLHPDTIYRTSVMGVSKKETTTPKAEQTAKKVTLKPRDAEWESVPYAPTQMDKLKGCAKWVLSFGGLNLLIFYWQMAELMAESVAVPCMWICCAMAGYGVGASVWRGRK